MHALNEIVVRAYRISGEKIVGTELGRLYEQYPGPASRLEAIGKLAGHIERAAEQTDLVTFSLGIAVGLLIGTWSVTVAGVLARLGSVGGLLDASLVIGYLWALHPTF